MSAISIKVYVSLLYTVYRSCHELSGFPIFDYHRYKDHCDSKFIQHSYKDHSKPAFILWGIYIGNVVPYKSQSIYDCSSASASENNFIMNALRWLAGEGGLVMTMDSMSLSTASSFIIPL